LARGSGSSYYLAATYYFRLAFLALLLFWLSPFLAHGEALHLLDTRNHTGTNGPATFTERETQALLHGNRCDELDFEGGVIARHHHLGAFGQHNVTCKRKEEESG
jgi:hypothetical protein